LGSPGSSVETGVVHTVAAFADGGVTGAEVVGGDVGATVVVDGAGPAGSVLGVVGVVVEVAGAGRTAWREPNSATSGSDAGVGWQPTAMSETSASPDSAARWKW
jgi:hypothetical protein